MLSVPSILKVGGDVEDLYVHIDVDIDILFLSDPSPIIGNACQWLTHWLTDSRLVNLIDVTLASEARFGQDFEF